MLRSFFARLRFAGPRPLPQCPARQSFGATVLAWDAMTRQVERAGERTRSFSVDNFS